MSLLDRLARTFPALTVREFRLFFAGQFVSLTGTWMQVVAQGWLVLQLTNSPFLVGLVSALGSLPILLFTLYGGVVADRVDRRRALLLLQSLMLVEALVLASLTASGHVTAGWVMLLAVVAGTLSAFEVPIRQSFLLEMVGRDHLMNAIALNSSNFNITRIVGPALAGTLIATVGLAACFFANAASFLAAIGALLRIAPRSPARPADPDRRPSFWEGVRYAMGQAEPRALLLLTAAFSIFGFSFIPMLPVYARNELGTGAAGYGGLLSAVGIGASLGALGVAAFGHRFAPRRLILAAGYTFGASLCLAWFGPSYGPSALLFAAAGCAMILNNITANTLLQSRSPDQLRGRVMGFYSLMVLGMAPLGSFQAGWVSEHFGVRVAMLVGGVVCVAATLVAMSGERSAVNGNR